MEVEIDSLVSGVMCRLDENEALVAERIEYGLVDSEIRTLIIRLLPENAERVILQAPREDIDEWEEFEEDVEWDSPGTGHLTLPADFLRLVGFRMSDWKRSVHTAISPDSEEYHLRFSPSSARKSIRKGPAVAVVPGFKRMELIFTGSTEPSAYPEICSYLSRPDTAGDGYLRIPRSLIPAVEEATASHVRRIRNT